VTKWLKYPKPFWNVWLNSKNTLTIEKLDYSVAVTSGVWLKLALSLLSC